MNDNNADHKSMTDEELVGIAFFERGRLAKEARISAKKILTDRGVSKVKLRRMKYDYIQKKKSEMRQRVRDKDEKFSYFDFVMNMFEMVLNLIVHF